MRENNSKINFIELRAQSVNICYLNVLCVRARVYKGVLTLRKNDYRGK